MSRDILTDLLININVSVKSRGAILTAMEVVMIIKIKILKRNPFHASLSIFQSLTYGLGNKLLRWL
jgi:hypothetical protein